MINYHSTDRSVDICRQMCPSHWKIVNTVNESFVASTNDAEIKVHEQYLGEGFKIALTITEFLFIPTPLAGLNHYMIGNNYDSIKLWGVCMVDTDPHNLPTYDKTLFEQKHHGMIKDYPCDPRQDWGRDSYNYWYGRYYHNKPFANYIEGRHNLQEYTTQMHNAYILKYGYSPWNHNMINRGKKKYDGQDKTPKTVSEEELENMYNHFLPHAFDLRQDNSFLNAYNYCVNL
jgi:hypothetical protein